ncbi:PREDICTED: uncharacterized protein LOC108610296 [Drosophila arizonae]|uniref:Uncharacterized protein LOC108610296 n=1 Tax=Drosophila arizonae TaxID=7263 RepID=A0ABM1NS52_DROAR|nr:PREDICTED: uncharacterized protein LOC108610296 [Drosophila arizonae]
MNSDYASDCTASCEASCTKGRKTFSPRVEQQLDPNYENFIVHELEDRSESVSQYFTNRWHVEMADNTMKNNTWEIDQSIRSDQKYEAYDLQDNQPEMNKNYFKANDICDPEDNHPEIKKKSTVLVLVVNSAAIYPNDNDPSPAPSNFGHQTEQYIPERQNDARANHQDFRSCCGQRPINGQMDHAPQNSFQNQPQYQGLCSCQDGNEEWYGENSNAMDCQCEPMCDCDCNCDSGDSQVTNQMDQVINELGQVTNGLGPVTTEMGYALLKLLEQHRAAAEQKAKTKTTTNRKATSQKRRTHKTTNQRSANRKATDMKGTFYNRFSTPPFVIEPKPRCYFIRGPVCCNTCNTCNSCNSCRCYQY